MGFISNWIRRSSVELNRRQLVEFLDKMRGMDGAELGTALAVATDFRHTLESAGHNPMDMITYVAINPRFALQLSRLGISQQKSGNMMGAVATMVWCHTARAAISPEHRLQARERWGHLARGRPHVRLAGLVAGQLIGRSLNVEGADQFPIGFTPHVL